VVTLFVGGLVEWGEWEEWVCISHCPRLQGTMIDVGLRYLPEGCLLFR
jgi:hypothetical protein